MTTAGAGAAGRPAAPAFEFAVEEGKAREFARATGADGLVADGGRLLAPATFLAACRLWMEPEHSAWHGIDRDYRRVLHGEERYSYPRGLPRVGARLHARQRFGAAFRKSGASGPMSFQEVITTFWTDREDDPDAVVTSLSITLPPPSSEPGASSSPSDAPAARPPAEADAAGALDTHAVGPLTITDFVRYQGASGDFNPIHHDTGFARAAGYEAPIAVGMLTAGVAADRFARLRHPRDLRALRMRWRAPVQAGDRLEHVVREDGAGLACRVSRGDGAVHMLGWAEYA